MRTVAQGTPDHELHGEVVDPLGVLVVVCLLGIAPPFHQQVPHGMGQRQVEIVSGTEKLSLPSVYSRCFRNNRRRLAGVRASLVLFSRKW
jgi:hypothetical protein